MRELLITSGILLALCSCNPTLPYDCSEIDTEDPELLADSLGPALAEVLTDGQFNCQDHQDRNQYNSCPQQPPEPGTDENGITWTQDRIFFGLLPNPYHAPLDCYRGTSEELGISSYQCCYDGEDLVQEGPLAGSFDFISPLPSVLAAIAHYLFDMTPGDQCGAI